MLKKITGLTLILFSILLFPFLSLAIIDYSGGLLDNVIFKVGSDPGSSNSGTTSYITDNDESTLLLLTKFYSSSDVATFEFPSRVNLSHFRLKTNEIVVNDNKGIQIRFYDENMVMIAGFYGRTDGVLVSRANNGVKYVSLINFDSVNIEVQEFQLYGVYPDKPLPPTNLSGTSLTKSVQLNWDDNIDAIDFYNIYQNNNLIGTSATSDFLVENVTPDVNYTYFVRSVRNTIESSNSNNITLKAMTDIIIPILSVKDITDKSLSLEWNQSGMDYKVYKDGVLIGNRTTNTFMDILNLQPDTEYQFYIIARDKYYREIQSNIITVKTERLQLSKPIVSVNQVSHDSFRMYWNGVNGADQYEIYLNNSLVTITTNLDYVFNNLEADTIYSLKLVAKNLYDEVFTLSSQRTNVKPVPTVSSATVAPPTSGGSERELTYTANDLVTEVAVYLNGELLGTFPVNDPIMLNFDLYDEQMIEVRVEPTDLYGVGTTTTTPTKSIGNDSVDVIMPAIINTFEKLLTGFMWLVLASLPLFIVVLVFFWIRKKKKGLMAKEKNEKKPFSETSQKTHIEKSEIFKDKKRSNPKRYKDKYEKMGFEKVGSDVINRGGLFSQKPEMIHTYKKNGIEYQEKFIKQGKRGYSKKIIQPKGFDNRIKHFQHTVKSVVGIVKKPNGGK